MRTSRLSAVLFAALCCLLMSSQARAQQAYGYASLSFDESTNTLTGYASTEVDYETAYYYNAEVEAKIKDQNGKVLASGRGVGNPSAFTVLDVFQALLCIRFSIVSSVIVAPRFLGCDGGYFDYFGWSGYWGGSLWDYGGFTLSPRERCIFNRLIFIASIIADFVNCLPTNVSCSVSSTQLLPSGLRDGLERSFLRNNAPGVIPGVTDRDTMTITCRATNEFGSPQRGLLVRFGTNNIQTDNGGHVNHPADRPRGTFSRMSQRTDTNGIASSVFTAPPFGGSTRVVVTADGFDGERNADIVIKVPGLEELPDWVNYRRFGGNTEHPFNHWGTPAANTGLRQIADDYKAAFYPNGWVAPPQGTAIDPTDAPTDYYKIHYNDMSLRLGGKFEVDGEWDINDDHDEHRVGINCDVRNRNVLTTQRARLANSPGGIFFTRGSTRTLTHGNHWHLRFEFGAQTAQLPVSTPFRGVPAAVPGRIEVEEFDIGDYTRAYYVPPIANPNPDRNPTVPVYPAADGSRHVGSTFGGEWLKYTVRVDTSGSYSFTVRVASPSGGQPFHFEVDGVNKTGPIYVPATGSWNTFRFVTFDNVWLDAGQRVVRLVLDGSGQHVGNFDYFTIDPYTAPQLCAPTSSELSACRNLGGFWDYDFCFCVYGP